MAKMHETICKPFSVQGQQVTSVQIAHTINSLANTPHRFIGIDLIGHIIPDASFHDKQEATNRLLQRWRKLGLAKFAGGRWSLTAGAWDVMQSAARTALTGEGEGK